jgi:hypothetical protein
MLSIFSSVHQQTKVETHCNSFSMAPILFQSSWRCRAGKCPFVLGMTLRSPLHYCVVIQTGLSGT